MQNVATNKLFSLFLAALCGVVVADLFIRLNGIVIAYLAEVRAMAWIMDIPKSIRVLAFWTQSFLFEVLVIAVLSVTIGSLCGAFLKTDYKLSSIVAFSFFLLTKCIYIYKVLGEIAPIYSPIIYFISISIVSVALFWASFQLGGYINKKIR